MSIQVLPLTIPTPACSGGFVFHQGSYYFFGGHKNRYHYYDHPYQFSNECYTLDWTRWIWGNLHPMPTLMQGFEIAAHGNYIYAFGGFEKLAGDIQKKLRSSDAIYRYTISEDKWELLPVALPTSRSSHILQVIGTKVYLIGGWKAELTPPRTYSYKSLLDSIDVFDLTTETCSTLPQKLSLPLRRAFTSVAVGNSIYLMGGIEISGSQVVKTVTRFDVGTGSVTDLKELPFKLFAPAATVLAGVIYVFGGGTDIGNYNTIFAYDIAKNEWNLLPETLEGARCFSRAGTADNTKIQIFSGYYQQVLTLPDGKVDLESYPLNQIEEFIP